MNSKYDIILATKSPRRLELFRKITPDFTSVPSDFDEKSINKNDYSPNDYVQILAAKKAESVYNMLGLDAANKIIIGCDTVVVSPRGEIYGIPPTAADAFETISSLSGKTHTVITGVCILGNSFKENFSVESLVTFKPLNSETVENYIKSEEYRDKAGGYGIQGLGALLVKEIKGDYFNIVGMPISLINEHLHRLNRQYELNINFNI